MTAYEHAEAHELLTDLDLEPEALRHLAMELANNVERATGDPLLEHVASCPACRDSVASWDRTHDLVRKAISAGPDIEATPMAELANEAHVTAPASLRDALLELVAAESRSNDLGSIAADRTPTLKLAPTAPVNLGRLALGRRLLPLAAAIAIVIVGGGVLLDQSARLDRQRGEMAALEAVTATVDRVLRDPAHVVVDLRAADGTAAGSISWSSRDLVILTSALPEPPAGRTYACWIERNGVRAPVGQMVFAGGTAFWTGSLDEWATTSFGSGTFGISLEPIVGPRGNPPVLVADLGT